MHRGNGRGGFHAIKPTSTLATTMFEKVLRAFNVMLEVLKQYVLSFYIYYPFSQTALNQSAIKQTSNKTFSQQLVIL